MCINLYDVSITIFISFFSSTSLSEFFFSSIIILSVLWDARHHMLLWNALSSPIQTWCVVLSHIVYAYCVIVPCRQLFFTHFMQVILGEEVVASKLTLFEITKQITDAVQTRAEQGLNNLNCFSIYVCIEI